MASFSRGEEEEIVTEIIDVLAKKEPDPVLTFPELYNHLSKSTSIRNKVSLHIILKKYSEVLEYFDDGMNVRCIRLNSKLSVCDLHCSKSGCCPETSPICSGLHICKGYLLSGTCKSEPCQFGHDLTTTHNMAILREKNVSGLPARLIKELVQKSKQKLPPEGNNDENVQSDTRETQNRYVL